MIKREYRDVLYALAQIVAFVHNYSLNNLEPYEERWMHDIYSGLISLSNETKPETDHLAEFKNIMDEAHVDVEEVHKPTYKCNTCKNNVDFRRDMKICRFWKNFKKECGSFEDCKCYEPEINEIEGDSEVSE